MRSRAPTLRVEKALHDEGFVRIAALDEVGRGALCGPVTVGAVLVLVDQRRPPRGLRDSKLLTPAVRESLVPRIRTWVSGYAVADASADEIDEVGIIAALGRAARRALAALPQQPDCVLLDGNHDYVTPRPPTLFDPEPAGDAAWPPVRTMIKADLRCASVAAASVLAKTTRDALMDTLHPAYPQFGWVRNKGYATPEHLEALRAHGPSPYHRRSWSLPSATSGGDAAAGWADCVDLVTLEAALGDNVAAPGTPGPAPVRAGFEETG